MQWNLAWSTTIRDKLDIALEIKKLQCSQARFYYLIPHLPQYFMLSCLVYKERVIYSLFFVC